MLPWQAKNQAALTHGGVALQGTNAAGGCLISRLAGLTFWAHVLGSCLTPRILSLNAYHPQGSRPMARFYQPISVLLIAAVAMIGCSKQDSSTSNGDGSTAKKQFISMGTAPVGGAFPVVGGAIAEVMNEHKEAFDWKVQAKGTKGSQENIRRLQQGELELALSNAAISYFATRGEGTWTKKYDIRRYRNDGSQCCSLHRAGRQWH